MEPLLFLYVGAGGALGSVCRYALSLIPTKSDFPVITLITNLIGAVLIGFIAGAAAKRENAPQGLILFLKTGFCGGFTTFSTFSLEAFALFREHHYFLGSAYAALSLVLCVAGVCLGDFIAKKAM